MVCKISNSFSSAALKSVHRTDLLSWGNHENEMLFVDLQPFRRKMFYRWTSRDRQKHNHKLFLNNQAYCMDWFSVRWEAGAVDKNTVFCFLCSKGAKIWLRHRDHEGNDLWAGSLWRGVRKRFFLVGKITLGYVSVRFFRQGLNLAGLRWLKVAWVKGRAMGFSLWQLCWLARRICWLWWSRWTFSGIGMAEIKENMPQLGLNMSPDKSTPRLFILSTVTDEVARMETWTHKK